MAASMSSSSMVIASDNNKWKIQFNEELLNLKNDSSNNPIYNETLSTNNQFNY